MNKKFLGGWIPPSERTMAQQRRHLAVVSRMSDMARYSLPYVLGPGDKVILSAAWKAPAVIKDVGFEFQGFRQFTGSCIGVSEGGAIFTLGAVQRLLAANPTKAFVPFWPVQYGRCRFNEGDRGPGEGAINSSMVSTLVKEGVLSAAEQGLPQFQNSDGLILDAKTEMQYSDGAAAVCTKWLGVERAHLLGSGAVARNTMDLAAGIANGYPGYFGCSNYCDRAAVKGSGDSAVVMGVFNGRGGHSQAVYGVWEHLSLGRLFLVGNTWAGNTYPDDPAGGPRCSWWTTEAEFSRVWTAYQGEVFNLSHLDWFPAQPDVPEVLNWYL